MHQNKTEAPAQADETPQNARGRLIGLFIADEASAPMRAVARVEAIAGRGLIGDRYHAGRGTFSGRFALVDGARALSVIDIDDVARCRARLALPIAAADLRRNLLIEGLDLLKLRDRRLCIGDVVIRLVGRCAPCGYLSRLVAADMRRGLHRGGGMRACIETGGILAAGAEVRPMA